MYYEMEIEGLKRQLPLCPVNDSLYIAGFVMFDDVDITVATAKALLAKAPDFDIIVTAESKGIPLAYEMARQSGKEYLVLRKGSKLYMQDVIETEVDSITTDHIQTLCLGKSDADKLSGRRVLIVDDVALNREILGDLLEDEFDILFAADGVETLEILRSHKDEIDLVLLDLQMPNKNGREVMAEMQVDEDLMSIPVLILTVDQNAELDCLKIGAMDFIPKPFPSIEIVKARIAKCIELSEDRDLIRHTERDKLTELLNKDYFLRYANRLDHIYKGTPMDAVALDVNRFHMLNKQYGRQFGDLVLHSIGVSLRKLARQTGGIGCRQGGDTFLLYCPHQEDYEKLLSGFLDDIHDNREIGNKVSMRFGLYLNAQRVTTVEERFARAKTAADSVKDDPQSVCGYYKEA